MEKLKDIAKELGITRLELSDKSKKIICGKNIFLAPYYILKHGQSWYNSLGFFSKNFYEEEPHNEKIRQKTLGHYTTIICDSIRKEVNRLKQIIEKPQISVFDRFMAQIKSTELNTIIKKLESDEFKDKYSSMTLNEFAIEIWDGKTNHCEHIDVLDYLFELIFNTNTSYDLHELSYSDKILYDRELYHEVGETGGSRKIQKKRTAKKRRKYRKSHRKNIKRKI